MMVVLVVALSHSKSYEPAVIAGVRSLAAIGATTLYVASLSSKAVTPCYSSEIRRPKEIDKFNRRLPEPMLF